jgi:hypothetical protein
MLARNNRGLAIACASGSFKGAFVHGVLSAFEKARIKADAYAAASSSVLPAAWSAIGSAGNPGVFYWYEGLRLLEKPDFGMSQIVQSGIVQFSSSICQQLFEPEIPNFFIATSAVMTSEAAEQTQGTKARRLGRNLLVSASKKDRSWADEHLALTLFDNSNLSLNANNFNEVAYASTRMLHAWEIPAWIEGKPFIDASYTCLCPAIEMVEAGYQEVIAIATEPGVLYRDFFGVEIIPNRYQNISIYHLKPDVEPKELGVDFHKATKEGLTALFRHGEEKGQEFILTQWKESN